MVIPAYDLESLFYVEGLHVGDGVPWRVMGAGRILARASTKEEAERVVERLRDVLTTRSQA